MKLWRVSEHADLSGKGGLIAKARWNRAGMAVVYCTDHPSTALLEKLAHFDFEDMPRTYRLFSVQVPDDAPRFTVETRQLPKNWKTNTDATQALGSSLLASAEQLMIWVPCALVPEAWNILLNPAHAESAECFIEDIFDEPFDPRLIR